MTLEEFVDRVEEFDRKATLVAPVGVALTSATQVEVVLLDEAEDEPQDRSTRTVMDVWHVQEVLDYCRERLRESMYSPFTSHDLTLRFCEYLATDA